jgi:hypothetical protein
MTRRIRTAATAQAMLIGLLGLVTVACGDRTTAVPPAAPTTAPVITARPAPKSRSVIDPGDGGRYAPAITPDDFVDTIDNPYLPLRPGASWTYEGSVDGERQHIEVVVRPERRTVMGVRATVVQDTVSRPDGTPLEITQDWFGQDRTGNVWYLGEASKDYENGKLVSTEGSWEAGVAGARPGIVMPAAPAPGAVYRQEYLAGEAEDMAEIIGAGGSVRVPAGSYGDLRLIREWTPIEPAVIEEKTYAPGVGNVLVVVTRGGKGRIELTKFTPGTG